MSFRHVVKSCIKVVLTVSTCMCKCTSGLGWVNFSKHQLLSRQCYKWSTGLTFAAFWFFYCIFNTRQLFEWEIRHVRPCRKLSFSVCGTMRVLIWRIPIKVPLIQLFSVVKVLFHVHCYRLNVKIKPLSLVVNDFSKRIKK